MSLETNILDKLNKVNSEKNNFVFKMEYKGKVVHSRKVEIPEYTQKIVDSNETKFFYFFKDMANKFEDMLNEIHKKKMWDDLENENINDGSER